MAWTEHNTEMLKRLWAEGKSADTIARAIGNISRNGVVGKAHRLGLERRSNPVRDRDTIFRAVCDRVIDAPLGEPVSIEEAAVAEGMSSTVARARWAREIESMHGGDPA